MNPKKEILSYLDNICLLLVGITLFSFPLLFSPITTDFFAIPKQALLIAGTTLSLLILGIRMLVDGKVRLRTTPFDFPLFILIVSVLLSSIFAVNRYDSLISFAPLLFSILLFFVITNVVKGEKSTIFIISSLVFGTLISTAVSVLSYFKIYLIPLEMAKNQAFTPLGSILDQALFIGLVLPITGYAAWPIISPLFIKKKPNSGIFAQKTNTYKASFINLLFTVAFALLIAGLFITVMIMSTIQPPYILPFTIGFQTAFASISQDTGRVLQGFLLGSGFGNYITDFTRFKSIAYNNYSELWSLSFYRSSSFVLELLATTGVLGIASYFFIIFKVIKEKTFFLPLALAIVASFILPFSFIITTLFFVLLALFAVLRAGNNTSNYSEIEFYFVALKHGLIVAQPEGERAPHDKVSTKYGHILPFGILVVLAAILGYMGYMGAKYVSSDIIFQQSLVAASKNNGTQTYNLQRDAITQFPYKDSYYRIFSQTNLALANSLASSQPKGASPSAQVQEQLSGLIQQSINSGRTAVSISPQNASNWNNLSAIYRAMIGFGENAEQFAILSNQQAIQLDPSNPQQYVNLGGIYFQLKNWEEAQRQFQVAINLKPDFSNAYYNLGHTLENKGDLKTALEAYKVVENLSADDKEVLAQIRKEIRTLEQKIASGTTADNQNTETNTDEQAQSELNVNTTENQLPESEDAKTEIPAPPTTLTPSPTSTKTTPTPTP